MDEKFRLGDNDRIHALQALGSHFAEGRLDSAEFDERTGLAAQARTVGDILPAFEDLPGGLPFHSGEDGRLVPVPLYAPDIPPGSAVDPDVVELQDLKRRGKKIEALSGVIIGLTLATFLVLQFVFGVGWAWLVWPSLMVTMAIPRMLYRYSDADEQAYTELKKVEDQGRKDRILRAAQRMRELKEDT
ncbi:DUF1707 SHOCT-like domain-containing protein [Corynebacterium sp. A21]|uniref:DUF1707 SHOCT-like domain-containing protein n=1 Tax=Corynebacterium sp. A21 TaxID=3457318 RepID=UPI003FD39D57